MLVIAVVVASVAAKTIAAAVIGLSLLATSVVIGVSVNASLAFLPNHQRLARGLTAITLLVALANTIGTIAWYAAARAIPTSVAIISGLISFVAVVVILRAGLAER